MASPEIPHAGDPFFELFDGILRIESEDDGMVPATAEFRVDVEGEDEFVKHGSNLFRWLYYSITDLSEK